MQSLKPLVDLTASQHVVLPGSLTITSWTLASNMDLQSISFCHRQLCQIDEKVKFWSALTLQTSSNQLCAVCKEQTRLLDLLIQLLNLLLVFCSSMLPPAHTTPF